MRDRKELQVLLPEYLLGTLPAEETLAVAEAIDTDAALRAEADELAEALGAMGLALTPLTPPPPLRQRLLDSIAATAGPAGRLEDRLAALFEVTVERARELLRTVADPAAWVAGPCEGTQLLHVQGGPRLATADVGFVRLKAGVRFPHHQHGGDERGLIIQGGFVDSSGAVFRVGDEQHNGPGTQHDFVALPGEDCVFAVVVFGGVQFDNGFRL